MKNTYKTIHKSDFIDKVAAEAGFTKKDTSILLETAITVLKVSLKSNKRVEWRGFGSFVPFLTKERTGFNPIANQKIKIKSHIIPRFHPSFGFKSEFKKEL